MLRRFIRKITQTITTLLRRYRKKIIMGVGSLTILVVIIQLVYPWNRLPLFTQIDGQTVGYMKRIDAAKSLSNIVNDQPIDLTVTGSKVTYATVKPPEIGLNVDYAQRVKAYSYPFLLRFIPSSLLWVHFISHQTAPSYEKNAVTATHYLSSRFGPDCIIPSKNASLTVSDGKITVVNAQDGGTCQPAEASAALLSAAPVVDRTSTVTVPVMRVSASINTSAAEALKSTIETNSRDGIQVIGGGKEITISQNDVVSWLNFNSDGDQLTFEISSEKSNEYFSKQILPLVEKPAGAPTVVTTRDFKEISRVPGQNGQTLNSAQTRANLYNVLIGQAKVATAATQAIPAKTINNRSYTKTNDGIKALIAQYAEDNPGSYGIAFQEISGGGTGASYQGDKQFITASTYKLFAAYGTLQKVDSGEWTWSDGNIASGRNLETCFTDMIVNSDNPCGEALLAKLGFTSLTKNLQSIGLTNTTFLKGDSPLTTAVDLSLFLQKLKNGDLDISNQSRDKLLGLMSRQVYRQGVPAGSKGSVADKVGFLNGLLHDASIVTLPETTYVLVVMSDGSSWSKIAELTRQLEPLL